MARDVNIGVPDDAIYPHRLLEDMIDQSEKINRNLALNFIEVVSFKLLVAAGDYAAEDVLSEAASGGTTFLFRNMSKVAGGMGTIRKAMAYLSVTNLTPRITLYLFKELPTTNLNDNVGNAAPSLSDLSSYQGKIDFPAMEDLGGVSASIATPGTYGNLPLDFFTSTRDLYGIAVTRDAITDEAAGMTMLIKLFVERG